MSAVALLAELAGAGICLSRNGDRLHVEAAPGAVTTQLHDRLVENKPALLALLDSPDGIRARLLALARQEDVPVELVHRLDDSDLTACVGCAEVALRAFLRALRKSAVISAGLVPSSFTVATFCPECGPVWLSEPHPPGAKTCPWCFRRRAGKEIPRP